MREVLERRTERSSNYVREIQRWATPGPRGYLAMLRTESIHSIDYTLLRPWQKKLVDRKVRRKTLWNVTGGLSAFLGWLVKTGCSTACKKLGVKVGLYEGTKHTLGTALKALGADDRVIAELFGHSDPRSVQYHAKVQSQTVRSAVARIDAFSQIK